MLGGVDATTDPEYYLKNGAEIIVRGEGELTIQKIIERLHNGKTFFDVPNIVCNDDGTIRSTEMDFLWTPLDVNTLEPQNLDIVDFKKYNDTGEGIPPRGIKGPFISIETSRGCARVCSFCATPPTKGRYRPMNLENVIRHLEYLAGRGIETLLFQEDNILSRIQRDSNGEYVFPDGRRDLIEIFRLAKEGGFSWEFTNGLEIGQYEIDGKIDQELIEAMFWNSSEGGKIKGCYRATVPLENLTDENSKLFKKLKSFEKNKKIIKSLTETGISMLAFNLIIGRPNDDENILRLSYKRCLDIKEIVEGRGNGTIPFFNIYNLSLLPGTPDFRKYKRYMAFDIDEDPEVVTFYLGSLSTDNFSPLEITQIRGSLSQKLNEGRLIEDFEETRQITSERFNRLFN